MKTNNNDIQNYVDTLTKDEKQRNQSLKQQLQDLNINVGGQSNSDNAKNDKVGYLIDNSRFDRSMPSDTKFAELQKIVTGSNGAESFFGYEDKDRQDILLRSDRDVTLCFKEYFGSSEKTVKFKNLKKNDVIDFLKLNFESDYTNIEDSCIFKLSAASKSDPAAFYGIKKNTTLAEAKELFSKVKTRPIKKLSFLDSDHDSIEILGDTEWEYFLNDCDVQYKNRKFNTLYAE